MTGPHRELLQRARYAPLHWPSTFTRCEKNDEAHRKCRQSSLWKFPSWLGQFP